MYVFPAYPITMRIYIDPILHSIIQIVTADLYPFSISKKRERERENVGYKDFQLASFPFPISKFKQKMHEL